MLTCFLLFSYEINTDYVLFFCFCLIFRFQNTFILHVLIICNIFVLVYGLSGKKPLRKKRDNPTVITNWNEMKPQYRFTNYGNQIIHAVRRCSSSSWQLRFLILPFNPWWTYPFIKKYMLAHYFIHELLATWLNHHPPSLQACWTFWGNLGFRRSIQIGHFSRHSFTQTHLAVRFLLLHKTRSRPRSHLPPITRGRVISFLFRHITTLNLRLARMPCHETW